MVRKIMTAVIIFLLAGMSVGCGKRENNGGKLTPVKFTVVKKDDLPEEVTKAVEKKGQKKFLLTCGWDDSLYIARGYGIQSSGGYSIQVDYVNENDKEIHIKTRLVGPDSREKQKEAVSCPFIVVKVTENNKAVIFD